MKTFQLWMAFFNFKCQWEFQVPSKFSETATLLRYFELTDSLEVPYGEDAKYSEMEKQNLNSDKIQAMFLPRRWQQQAHVFYFLFFPPLWSSVHFFPFHSIRYQLSNWWATFCHYFSMFQYNLLHLDIFKDHGFQCGSVLFIKWHNSHRGLTVQAVPCTECGSEESEYRASFILTPASLVGSHLGYAISYQ